eukprot:TRINITY_DN3451_c0_g1_i2.p1 TRINITY_DN3451_c0_g1~~TRINITY_DN3451_c0_g1_i2.p1  ORF type:complete len:131 (+),score=44.81 TRINITY_DN3451_c0_g1_i2:323-715(+)
MESDKEELADVASPSNAMELMSPPQNPDINVMEIEQSEENMEAEEISDLDVTDADVIPETMVEENQEGIMEDQNENLASVEETMIDSDVNKQMEDVEGVDESIKEETMLEKTKDAQMIEKNRRHFRDRWK